jgi:hypothetical protein
LLGKFACRLLPPSPSSFGGKPMAVKLFYLYFYVLFSRANFYLRDITNLSDVKEWQWQLKLTGGNVLRNNKNLKQFNTGSGIIPAGELLSLRHYKFIGC